METKFTPGPWSIHGKNWEDKILIGQVGKENNTGKVAVIGWNCCGKDSPEWEANAKLIAVAPEMLDVLDKICKNYYLSVKPENDITQELISEAMKIFTKLK